MSTWIKPYKWLRVLLLVVISASIVSADETQPPSPDSVPEGYEEVFFDGFDDEGLDATHWSHRYAEGHEYGEGLASHASVTQPSDGYVYLTTRYENEQFLTGMIRSVPQFQYGYFEASIRFQTLQGHHGAFWLQSETYGDIVGDPGQSGAEIDIIEFFGNGRIPTDAKQNVYYDPYVSGQKQPGEEFSLFYRDHHDGVELSEEFHTFGLLWTEDEYVFYIDGFESWRTDANLSHVQEYMILSLTTSGWEHDKLVAGNLPDGMVVDYVRVYQPQN